MDNQTTERTIRKAAECQAEGVAAIRTAELMELFGSPKLAVLAREYRAHAARWLALAAEYRRDVPPTYID